jgi:excisionase family DNA binding protein
MATVAAMASKYISVAEAARILEVHPQVAYKLVYDKRVKAVRRGNRWLVERASVMERKAKLTRRDECITIEEVAVFFGVHVETVRHWHLDGLLPGELVFRQLCFDERDVVTFVPAGGRPSAHEPTRTLRGRYYPPPPEQPKPPPEEEHHP